MRLKLKLALLAALVSRGAPVIPVPPLPCSPQFTVLPSTRLLPQSYRDQAMASVRALYPGLRVMLDRPFGTIGSVNYSLVAFHEGGGSAQVHITGAAATFDNESAWRFDATCKDDEFATGVVATMEGLSRLIGPIKRPLTDEALTRGQFVAYTLLWQVDVPGGDPIVFLGGGSFSNARAGLSGRWAIVDDSTLAMGDRRFDLRQKEGDLVSPWPLDGPRRAVVYWIERAGALRPREAP